MKRDMDLIHELLFRLETFPAQGGNTYFSVAEDLPIEGRSAGEIEEHLGMIYDAGFVDPHGRAACEAASGRWLFRGLTWQGHDFVGSIRDAGVWEKSKAVVSKMGDWGLGVLAEVAKGLAKQKVKELLGLDPM